MTSIANAISDDGQKIAVVLPTNDQVSRAAYVLAVANCQEGTDAGVISELAKSFEREARCALLIRMNYRDIDDGWNADEVAQSGFWK